MGWWDKMVSDVKKEVLEGEKKAAEKREREEENASYNVGERGFVKTALTRSRNGQEPSNEEVSRIVNEAHKKPFL